MPTTPTVAVSPSSSEFTACVVECATSRTGPSPRASTSAVDGGDRGDDARRHADRVVVRGREHAARDDRTGVVAGDGLRERSADVDADPDRHRVTTLGAGSGAVAVAARSRTVRGPPADRCRRRDHDEPAARTAAMSDAWATSDWTVGW